VTVEDLHDSAELGWVIVQLLEQRRGLAISMHCGHLSIILRLIPGQLLRFILGLQRLVDGLVGVDDEGNDDVDEDEVGQLHEGDEVQEHCRVFLLFVDGLKHEDDGLPVVLPHDAEERIHGHQVVVEVQVEPVLTHVVRVVNQGLLYELLVDLAAEEFKTYGRVD